MLAVIGICAACAIGVIIGIIRKKRNVSDYDRIFGKSRVLWLGQKEEEEKCKD